MTTEPEPRLRALADFAWVELAPADDTFIPGGVIVAPQSAADRDTYRKATVRSIGPGRYHEGHYYPCGAEVGDTVLVAQSRTAAAAGLSELLVAGRTFTLVRQVDIHALYDEQE